MKKKTGIALLMSLLVLEAACIALLSAGVVRVAVMKFAGLFIGRPLIATDYWDNFLSLNAVMAFIMLFTITLMSLYLYARWEHINPRRDLWKVRFICAVVFTVFVVLNAWQADDGYLSHKVSYNLAHGNGLVFNAGERLQVPTCPLHTIIVGIVYKLFGHIYLSSLFLCVLYSIAAFLILAHTEGASGKTIALAALLFVFSKCFVSFTTSGLENSLLFLLFAVLLSFYLKFDVFNGRRIFMFSFVCSLILLTRMDNALIVFPLLVYVFFKHDTKNYFTSFLFIVLGMLPFIFWEMFSLVYYGFPFPNTVYVKLGTKFPLTDYIYRGAVYFRHTISEDTLVIGVPLLFAVVSVIIRRYKYMAVSAGMMLYYIYIVYIGGDFMVGRFFTVSFFIAVFCFTAIPESRTAVFQFVKKSRGSKIVLCFLCCLLIVQGVMGFLHLSPNRRIVSGGEERNIYFPATSLISRINRVLLRNDKYLDITDAMDAKWSKGMEAAIAEIREKHYKGDILSFVSGIQCVYHGDGLYLSDVLSLSDPLLARLPAVRIKGWVIGHMRREIPAGYRRSIQTGVNHVEDPGLREYLDILWEITRGKDLFTKERLQKIIDINLGKYDYLIEEYVERNKTGGHYDLPL